jgi:hypothetical protein
MALTDCIEKALKAGQITGKPTLSRPPELGAAVGE